MSPCPLMKYINLIHIHINRYLWIYSMSFLFLLPLQSRLLLATKQVRWKLLDTIQIEISGDILVLHLNPARK